MRQIVAIDFETANYSRASAIALGVSVIQDGVVTKTNSWLFRPPGPDIYIRRDFVAIHGIRPEDLEDKPCFEDIWHHAAEDLEKADWLLAHNARFDRNVLYAMAAYYEIALPRYKWQCTVNISRATWPGLVNHKLSTVCAHLGIPLKHHDPASDAEACARIFLHSNRERRLSQAVED
jgi:DNA polymerase III subunit epsilon